MSRITQILSILSFIISASMLGGAYFGYKYVTSPQLKNRIMNEILLNVQQMMPKMLDNEIPKITGESIPISNAKDSDSKWFWDYIEKRNKELIEWEVECKWK